MAVEKRVRFGSRWLPYALVAPQLAVVIVFFFWPAAQALYQSVLAQDAFGASREFVGLENFRRLADDDTYIASFRTTALFSVLVAFFGRGPLANGPDAEPVAGANRACRRTQRDVLGVLQIVRVPLRGQQVLVIGADRDADVMGVDGIEAAHLAAEEAVASGGGACLLLFRRARGAGCGCAALSAPSGLQRCCCATKGGDPLKLQACFASMQTPRWIGSTRLLRGTDR